VTYKAAYRCHFCKKHFTKPGEEVFNINNVIVDPGRDRQLHWRWIKESDKVERVELWFHRECFKAIAGDGYLSKEKQDGV
jgi:hypothetical protein